MRIGLSKGLPVRGPLGAVQVGPPPPPPTGLFGAGEAGFQYDPSDFSTMSVARDGSGPVPAIGDVVGALQDISGNGHHATAPSDAARPRLEMVAGRPALSFDGVDDVLQIPSLSIGPEFSVFAGLQKNSKGMIIGALSGPTPPVNVLLRAGSTKANTGYPSAAGANQFVAALFGPALAEITLLATSSDIDVAILGGGQANKAVSGGLAQVTSELFIGDGGVSAGDAIAMAFFGLAVFTDEAVDTTKLAEAQAWISTQTGSSS